MRLGLGILALTLIISGCTTLPQPAPADQPLDRTVQVTDDRPEPTFGNVSTGPAAGPDTELTLDRAPRWVPGEWWRIHFRSPFDGAEAEYVRVVADVQDGNYVVGMPHEGWYKEAVVYHSPAFGDVNADLSYDTHDELFTPLQWPLTEDATWETQFSGGGPMTAHVKLGEDHTATVTFTQTRGSLPLGQGPEEETTVLELVYDAKIHEVREFKHPTVEWQVVEHGYNFTGWITVPRGEDLVFIHGRIAAAVGVGPNGLQPAAPTETVDVAGGYNRVTFVQVVGSFTPAPGVYRETVTAPDGTVYQTEAVPGTGLTVAFFENSAPDGTWQLEHVAGGAGIVFTEGIAYHQYDIHLPDGGRRADHSHKVIR